MEEERLRRSFSACGRNQKLQLVRSNSDPTFERRTKLQPAASHDVDETLNNLVEERKKRLESSVAAKHDDKRTFLTKVKNRLDRVGIEIPTIEVRFENLTVETELYVTSRALPSFFSFIINIIEGICSYLHVLPNRRKTVTILKNIHGIIKPKRMTLLLGPSSSGKTTFMQALTGNLDGGLKKTGNITYNGRALNEFVPQRSAAYISQQDVHHKEMTVRETLMFAATCQGAGSRFDILSELLRKEKEINITPDPDLDVLMKGEEPNVITDYIMKILGLEDCADKKIGDEVVKGISGGQKKLVTAGEILVGPTRALFMDEISTGLDVSTAYQVISSIRDYVQIMNGTALLSLLQPPPEVYDLFEDVILLAEGQIVYAGCCEHVLDFFQSLGFKCPEKKSITDFFEEVISRRDQEQYWVETEQSYRFITVKEFAEAFRSYHIAQKTADELKTAYDNSQNHPASLTSKKYGVNFKSLFKACFAREILLMRQNWTLYIVKLVQLIVMAFIFVTLCFRKDMHRRDVIDGYVFIGALFFSISMIVFNGMTELSSTVAKLPIFYKQRDLLFYPSWVYALCSWLFKFPFTFIEVGIWVFITYYAVGFDPNAERLFRQYFLLLLVNEMATGLSRAIAAWGRNMIVSQTLASFAILVIFGLDSYWISPVMYGQSAMAENEFLGHSWRYGELKLPVSLGKLILKNRDFLTSYWIGIGSHVGFAVLFNICFTLALEYLNPPDNARNEGAIESTEEAAGTQATNASNNKGMILPFKPHSIAFSDIAYSIDTPPTEDKIVLLRGVSGAFRPGVLTAVMGVSGAGKTALLDVLAGRKPGSHISGDIWVSGYPRKQETFARVFGYCEQRDIHSPYVTVYESLWYSAWLRLPAEVDSTTRKMFIEEIMELLELNPLKQALVGLAGVNGLSTEQRKRLTIAVELVANPSIIFMDEPTTGIDARTVAVMMRTIRNVVDTGRTVVCTIQQPSINVFETFDELILLKKGGQEIFVGPLGREACHLINYFEGIEGTSKIKKGCNPATWMLEVSSSTQEAALGVDFAEIYKNSELYRRNKELVDGLNQPTPELSELYFPTKFSRTFLSQCMACFWKQRLSYWRNPHYTAVRLIFTTVIALIYGAVFWGLGTKTKSFKDLFKTMGSMYSSLLFLGEQNAASVQPVVDAERRVFYRERAAGMYSAIPYAIAQVLIEIPYIFVQAMVYGIITYSMIGYEWTAAKLFSYLFFKFSSLMYFTFYGMMIVAMTPNEQVASVISNSVYAVWNLFSGFIIPQTRMPGRWVWYYWICPVSWTLYGLVVSQFGDIKEPMLEGPIVNRYLEDFYGYKHEFLGVAAAINVVFPIVFAVGFALAMRTFNFLKR